MKRFVLILMFIIMAASAAAAVFVLVTPSRDAVSSLPATGPSSSSGAAAETYRNSVKLSDFIEAFISVAEKQPRYPVKDGKTVYGELFDNPDGEWCSEFVMYCLKEAEDELGTDYIGKAYPWRDNGYDIGLWFKRHDRYYDAGGSFMPARGDLVLFDTVNIGSPNHVGIVTGTVVENGAAYILTIEGNIPEDEVKQVRSRKLAVDDEAILAYCSTSVVSEYTGPVSGY